MKKIFNYWWK